jgi:hypothetical protein
MRTKYRKCSNSLLALTLPRVGAGNALGSRKEVGPCPHRIVFQGGKLAEPRQAEPFDPRPVGNVVRLNPLTDGPLTSRGGLVTPLTLAASSKRPFSFPKPTATPGVRQRPVLPATLEVNISTLTAPATGPSFSALVRWPSERSLASGLLTGEDAANVLGAEMDITDWLSLLVLALGFGFVATLVAAEKVLDRK